MKENKPTMRTRNARYAARPDVSARSLGRLAGPHMIRTEAQTLDEALQILGARSRLRNKGLKIPTVAKEKYDDNPTKAHLSKEDAIKSFQNNEVNIAQASMLAGVGVYYFKEWLYDAGIWNRALAPNTTPSVRYKKDDKLRVWLGEFGLRKKWGREFGDKARKYRIATVLKVKKTSLLVKLEAKHNRDRPDQIVDVLFGNTRALGKMT